MSDLSDYKNYVRANLPAGMTIADQYFFVNDERFTNYIKAEWYLQYITKFGFNGGSFIAYAANGITPPLIAAFDAGVYAKAGAASTFEDSYTFSRLSAATYTDASGVLQEALAGVARVENHIWDGAANAWVKGYLHNEASTQLLHTTNALVTQAHTVTAALHTLHFTGAGTVTLSGASTSGPLVGTGTGEQNRVSLSFTPSAANLTLTVSGTVTDAQLETGVQTAYIPNLAASGTVIRAADVWGVPIANIPYPTGGSLAVSFAMEGFMTYADNGTTDALFVNWELNNQNYILMRLDTNSTLTGRMGYIQGALNVTDFVFGSGAEYGPGTNVPFKVAMRNGSTFINGASNGTVLTANTTPTVFPNLSALDMQLLPIGNFHITKFRMWGGTEGDIGDIGLGEVVA
jgi:hypothetical protein